MKFSLLCALLMTLIPFQIFAAEIDPTYLAELQKTALGPRDEIPLNLAGRWTGQMIYRESINGVVINSTTKAGFFLGERTSYGYRMFVQGGTVAENNVNTLVFLGSIVQGTVDGLNVLSEKNLVGTMTSEQLEVALPSSQGQVKIRRVNTGVITYQSSHKEGLVTVEMSAVFYRVSAEKYANQ